VPNSVAKLERAPVYLGAITGRQRLFLRLPCEGRPKPFQGPDEYGRFPVSPNRARRLLTNDPTDRLHPGPPVSFGRARVFSGPRPTTEQNQSLRGGGCWADEHANQAHDHDEKEPWLQVPFISIMPAEALGGPFAGELGATRFPGLRRGWARLRLFVTGN